MSLNIIFSGHLIRYPLAGPSWHNLNYILGLKELGYNVTYVEDFGWSYSCYDPSLNTKTTNPDYGVSYASKIFEQFNMDTNWSYISEEKKIYGIPRNRLREICNDCDLFISLGNVNWIPEFENTRTKIMIDTDPVFTQIGAHGLQIPLSNYDSLFTYGENINKPSSRMPTGSQKWKPTRVPLYPQLFPPKKGKQKAPFTTVMNWSPWGDKEYKGHVYGMKEREFEPFFDLPLKTAESMLIAVNATSNILPDLKRKLSVGNWNVADPLIITKNLWTYRDFIDSSRAEFSVAKHGYVTTNCGWFSERSLAYMSIGRPVLIQDTGFSEWLTTGLGVLPFRNVNEVLGGMDKINSNYASHCSAAREIALEFFNSKRVLNRLIEVSLNESR
jgi:hypothetical protein